MLLIAVSVFNVVGQGRTNLPQERREMRY
ncbi:MAG: hypothetical protein RLZZ303_2876, partial [Candidatus Hydrogenedentota bacterium]